MASQKIDPLSVIRQHTPTPEQPKSASSWFKTERMELDFGDYVGRPSENVTAHKEVLSQLLQQGWYVTEVSNGGSEGEWRKVSSQQKSGTSTETGTKVGTTSETSAKTATASESSVRETNESQVSEGSRSTVRDGQESSSKTGTETAAKTGSETIDRSSVGKTTKTGTESASRKATEGKVSEGDETTETVGKETGGTSEKSKSESKSHSVADGTSTSQNNYNTFTNGTGSKGQTSGGGNSFGSSFSSSTNDAEGTSSSESTSSSLDGEATETASRKSKEEVSATTDEESGRTSKEDGSEETKDASKSESSETSAGESSETASGTSSETQDESSSETGTKSGSENGVTTSETSEQGLASGSQEERSSGSRSDDETVTADETDPYWCAWRRIRLERRRMQAELVLQSMIDTFVANFNEGRQINVDRYEELVALYALMVSQTQDDASNIDLDSIDFGPLFDEVKRAITEKLSEYQSVADAIPSDWLESRRADINLKFDNLVSEAQAKMITDGTYNGIVWPSVLAGIEHQRSHALDALKDESVGLKLNAYGDIAKTTSALYSQMIDAEVRVFEALKSKKTTPITLRNEVLKWMYDFMERRTDDHVKVSELAALVQQLGYDGGIVAPASVVS